MTQKKIIYWYAWFSATWVKVVSFWSAFSSSVALTLSSACSEATAASRCRAAAVSSLKQLQKLPSTVSPSKSVNAISRTVTFEIIWIHYCWRLLAQVITERPRCNTVCFATGILVPRNSWSFLTSVISASVAKLRWLSRILDSRCWRQAIRTRDIEATRVTSRALIGPGTVPGSSLGSSRLGKKLCDVFIIYRHQSTWHVYISVFTDVFMKPRHV